MAKNQSWLSRIVATGFRASILPVSIVLGLAGCGGGTMSVPARQLVAISVQPSNGDAIAPSGTIPFAASGTFDQAPTTEESLAVQWSSSDPSVATIDAGTGIASCVAAGGPVTITASKGAKVGSGMLTCLGSPPAATGHCVYVCGSTRCGALTGYCSGSDGGVCRQGHDPGSCPIGKPANNTATDSCGVGIDTTRPCTP